MFPTRFPNQYCEEKASSHLSSQIRLIKVGVLGHNCDAQHLHTAIDPAVHAAIKSSSQPASLKVWLWNYTGQEPRLPATERLGPLQHASLRIIKIPTKSAWIREKCIKLQKWQDSQPANRIQVRTSDIQIHRFVHNLSDHEGSRGPTAGWVPDFPALLLTQVQKTDILKDLQFWELPEST